MNALADAGFDLPHVTLSLSAGDRVRVALHGAHVLSWQTADGVERLYLSPTAEMNGRDPIRGGVPICFPQFNQRVLGDRVLPKHGLARVSPWQADPVELGADQARVRLRWRDDAQTLALWPFHFEANLDVVLAPGRLRLEFSVANTDQQSWPFALALHTYLRIPDIDAVRLHGLQGVAFWDAVAHLREPSVVSTQVVEALGFGTETDRVYQSHAVPLELSESGTAGSAGRLKITQSANLTETVVWNPGPALRLADMPGDGFRHMVCVEAARINEPVVLQPQQKWVGWQQLAVVS